jgi:hypothetical protein
MYTGPINDGVCPLTNSEWGHTTYSTTTCGECPLSASHEDVDGRRTRGHVDDYWIDLGEPGPDPWVRYGWMVHTDDCIADFMGTSQWKYPPPPKSTSLNDGYTYFYADLSGAPAYDYRAGALRDGCHGMRLFVESRGYRVLRNFSQLIKDSILNNHDEGFTFADFQAEIDAGRPVIIHLWGHTMLGYGYDTSTNTIYIRDTWDYGQHEMTWGGTYYGYPHVAVTVIQLQPEYTIAAGYFHTVGLKFDGKVLAVGENEPYGQCNVNDWEHIVRVAAGCYHTVGLKSDGTVVAVGRYVEGQCNISDWTGIVQIAAGCDHTVGVKSDGTVVAAGDNGEGQCNITDWVHIVQVAAGWYHTVGLENDGLVVAVGAGGDYAYLYDYGQCNVTDWEDIVQIAAGASHTVGLKSDGKVVAVGTNVTGECNVTGWEDIVQVAAGMHHTVGLKSDGTVVAAGWNNEGQCNVGNWTEIIQVAAGEWHTVGVRSDGTAVAVGAVHYDHGQCDVDGWDLIP